MRILYGIQGTGNGHISRAIEIIPYLQKWGETDILLSGQDNDIELPFEIKYRFKGLGFIFGNNGGIDIMSTYLKNKFNRFYKEIKKLPVEDYDLIISDFEPVSAWACFLKNKSCIGLSNQVAVLSEGTPQPKNIDPLGKLILKSYCPTTTGYGFHFRKYNDKIFTPVLRREIRNLTISDKGFYLVYLPSYDDKKIINMLTKFPEIKWRIFSKRSKKNYSVQNIDVFRIDKDEFLKNMASCTGLLCNASFTSTSEALYLKKKLMVIPMKGQLEQQCNALALKQLGAHVMRSIKPKHEKKLKKWLIEDLITDVDFPDETEKIIEMIVKKHSSEFQSKDK